MELKYLLIPIILISACVPKSQVKKAHDAAFAEANTECNKQIATLNVNISTLKLENMNKTERLKRFNQVDEDGRLYPLVYKGDKTTDKPLTGKEPWMK